MKKMILLLTFCSLIEAGEPLDGKKVFETYCWGCHHQSAMAFGPSFSEIASKRTPQEIKAYIIEPEAMYKSFGYKRSAMTQFKLKEEELDAVVKYIYSYKGK